MLKFLQARDPKWVNHPFFAKYDPKAAWLDDLRPAFGAHDFFFERAMRDIKKTGRSAAWGEPPRRRRPQAAFGHVEWE